MNKKTLSLPILISLVIGNVIGMGIYVLPASLAEYGTISILAWIYTSIGAMFLALTFSSLNKRFPKTGGPYVYCKEAFGNLVGFFVAYTYWISNMIAISGLAVSIVGYLGFIVPALNANHVHYDNSTVLFAEISIVWFFTLVNIIGLHAAGVVQLFLTILKLIPLLLIIFIGLGHLHIQNLELFKLSNESDFTAISSAATLTFWAFIGLESATVPAENTKSTKDVFKATVFGTLIAAVMCIASTFVLMGMMPVTELKSSQFPFAQAGTIIFGSYSAFIIAVCAVISGLGALNVTILIQGQVIFAAARDQLFPALFAKLSKRDVPVASQILSSSLITIFLIITMERTLLKQFNNIAMVAVSLTLMTYFITTLSELKFVITNRTSMQKAIFSKSMLIATLAASYALWMISNLNKNIYIFGIILLTVSIPVYFFSVKKQDTVED